MRVINIRWFLALTEILDSYMDVLRYEMSQGPSDQTVEALIHAEIFKILVREFPSDCVRSEFLIGHHFKNKVSAEEANGDEGKKRKLRADIAIFKPLEKPEKGSVDAEILPFAVFELKRTGTQKQLLDDVYRLAIVSHKVDSTGYLVLAAPVSHLFKMVERIEIFNQLDTTENVIVPIKFSVFEKKTTLYNSVDHKEKEEFYVTLMGGSKAVLASLKARLAVMKPSGDGEIAAGLEGEESEEDEGDEEDDQPTNEAPTDQPQIKEEKLGREYGFLIYGVSQNRETLKEKPYHRMALTLSKVEPQADDVSGDPVLPPDYEDVPN